MDRDRLDLSALAPPDDHWQAVLAATLARAELELRPRRADPLLLISCGTRPLLAAAAVLLALLVPVEIALERGERRAEQVGRLVALSTGLAHGGELPTGAELARVLDGGSPR